MLAMGGLLTAMGGLLTAVAFGLTPTVPVAHASPPAAVGTPSPSTVVSASQLPGSCDSAEALRVAVDAEALRAAGLLDEAVKTYASLLATPTTQACAHDGLHTVAVAYLDQADHALDAGRGETAQGYLDRALQLDPTITVPAALRDLSLDPPMVWGELAGVCVP
jgi:anti-sigma factor ChrR (cupin superfamily)